MTGILLGLSWSRPVLADDTSSGSSDDQQVVTTQENTAESAQSSNEPNNNSQADSTQKILINQLIKIIKLIIRIKLNQTKRIKLMVGRLKMDKRPTLSPIKS